MKVIGDGRCDSPGYSAKYGEFNFFGNVRVSFVFARLCILPSWCGLQE